VETDLSWDTSRDNNDLDAVKGLVELVCRVTIDLGNSLN
jgi:hypothetical protein